MSIYHPMRCLSLESDEVNCNYSKNEKKNFSRKQNMNRLRRPNMKTVLITFLAHAFEFGIFVTTEDADNI